MGMERGCQQKSRILADGAGNRWPQCPRLLLLPVPQPPHHDPGEQKALLSQSLSFEGLLPPAWLTAAVPIENATAAVS